MSQYGGSAQANDILARLTSTEALMQCTSLACMTDKHANCIFANQAWQAFTGRDQAQSIGEGWLHAIHLLDVQRFLRAYRAACTASVAFIAQYRLRRADGSYAWIQHESAPQFDTDASLKGFVNVLIDATTIQQIRGDLQGQQAVLREARDTVDRLQRVLSATAHIDTLDSTLKFILDQALSLLHAQAGIIFRLDGPDGSTDAQPTLTPVIHLGLPDHFAKRLATPFGEGLIGQVALQRTIQSEPITWAASANLFAEQQEKNNEPRHEPRRDQFIQMFTRAIAAPLIARHTPSPPMDSPVIGVLAFYKQASAQFQPDQVNILEALASQISTIIAASQKFDGANSSATFRL